MFKKISVIGLGYIGLPTAAMFASRKIEVVGVDINQVAVDTINQGKVHHALANHMPQTMNRCRDESHRREFLPILPSPE